MDFYVYDNIMTFNKRMPFNGVDKTRLEINKIQIPDNGSFWFFTDMNQTMSNINTQKRYVHIHKGMGTTNKVRFKKDPFEVTRGSLIYNPKERRVEVKSSILPWKKPLYAKKCTYYGAELPSKKMSILGTWYFDFPTNSIIFILDYFPQRIKFHWEEENEKSIPELLVKKAELESKILEAETQLLSGVVDVNTETST